MNASLELPEGRAYIRDQLSDPLHAQALVDRFQNNAYDLVVDGPSYRKRQKPSSGT